MGREPASAWYALAVGHGQPRVVTSWKEAKAFKDGYNGSKLKRFESRAEAGQARKNVNNDEKAENGELLWSIANAHRGGVTALQVSHNRKFVVSGGEEGEVRVWEIRTREMILHLKQHTATVTSLQLFADDTEYIMPLPSAALLPLQLCQELEHLTVSGPQITDLQREILLNTEVIAINQVRVYCVCCVYCAVGGCCFVSW